MFVIPDFSYFAVPKFIDSMSQYTNRSSSIILHNKSGDDWDKVLHQEDAYLMTWLHNKTEKIHNIFLPYSPNQEFLYSNSQELLDLIQPAIPRIKNYLLSLGVEDIDEYMSDSQEWLSILFGIKQYYFSAELTATYFGLERGSFPIILIWTDVSKSDLIVIYPNSLDENMTEYVKSLYWCITKATNEIRNKRINIHELKLAIEKRFTESHHIKGYSKKVEFIDVIKSSTSIKQALIDIGNQYKNNFDDAILNFEEYIQSIPQRKNITILSNESKVSVVSQLRENGFTKIREGGSHEIWQHSKLNKFTTVPRHNKLSPFVLKSIQKDIEAAIV